MYGSHGKTHGNSRLSVLSVWVKNCIGSPWHHGKALVAGGCRAPVRKDHGCPMLDTAGSGGRGESRQNGGTSGYWVRETILLETEENGEKVLQALEHRFPCSPCRRTQNTEEQAYPDGLHLYEESMVKWMNRRRWKQQQREAMYWPYLPHMPSLCCWSKAGRERWEWIYFHWQ